MTTTLFSCCLRRHNLINFTFGDDKSRCVLHQIFYLSKNLLTSLSLSLFGAHTHTHSHRCILSLSLCFSPSLLLYLSLSLSLSVSLFLSLSRFPTLSISFTFKTDRQTHILSLLYLCAHVSIQFSLLSLQTESI